LPLGLFSAIISLVDFISLAACRDSATNEISFNLEANCSTLSPRFQALSSASTLAYLHPNPPSLLCLPFGFSLTLLWAAWECPPQNGSIT
jgi:hypothetical protein